jgi:hypothetical protein
VTAPAPPRFRTWLRVALGAAILGAVILWVVREGDYLRNLSLRAVALSTGLSLLTVLLNGRMLQAIAATYGRSLAYADAVRLSSFASIGNAAGGLPLGTALKFSVLHERVGLGLAQIAAGTAAFTVGISLTLMLFAAAGVTASAVPAAAKLLAFAAWAGAVIVTAAGAAWLARHPRAATLVSPFTQPGHLARCAALSALVATSFVANSCATGALLLPGAAPGQLVFIASAGILLGLLSFLQGVAGIQELTMALMALVVGIDAAEGAQIALTLRATAIAGALLVLLAQLVLRRGPQREAGR